MTTLDNPSIAQFLVFRLGKAITKRQEAKSNVATRANTWVQSTMRLILHIAGLSSLTYAGFEWHSIAGFVTAGLSFFVLSWLTTPTTVDNRPAVDPMANRR